LCFNEVAHIFDYLPALKPGLLAASAKRLNPLQFLVNLLIRVTAVSPELAPLIHTLLEGTALLDIGRPSLASVALVGPKLRGSLFKGRQTPQFVFSHTYPPF
jgi:hypothetical protein